MFYSIAISSKGGDCAPALELERPSIHNAVRNNYCW